MVILFVLSMIFKQDFFAMLGQTGGGAMSTGAPAPSAPYQGSAEEEKLVDFISFVLDDAQDVWAKKFQERGMNYRRAKLVLFSGAVQSACGFQQSATGPFYCPADHKVYIDLAFYRELATRFGAPGDFAQAYVLAHEIGHHIQNLLGTNEKVRQAQSARPAMRNQLQVGMELQADCYAGIWGHSTSRRNLLEQGDVEEGLGAAAAVGDDRLQKQSRGYVSPESFTHGSSKQRMEWFSRGMQSGSVDSCDTFR